MPRLCVLSALALGWALPLRAQLTLEECLRLARENYPLLEKFELIARSTEYSVQNVKRGYLPQLRIVGQASWQSAVTTLPESMTDLLEQTGTTMEGLRKDQYRVGLELNQIVWDGGAIRAQKERQEAEGQVEQAQVEVELYALRERVNELFFGLLLIDRKLKLQEELEALLQSDWKKTRNLVTGGMAMPADADRLQVEVLKARRQYKELEAMRRTYRQMLGLFIGRPEEEVKELQRPEAMYPSVMESRRPELALFASQQRQNAALRRQADSFILPKFSLFAQGFYGSPGLDLFADMMKPEFSFGGIVGVRLLWDLSSFYTHGKTRRKLDLASARIDNAREVFDFNNRMQTLQERIACERFRSLKQEDEEIVRLTVEVRKAAESGLEQGVLDASRLMAEILNEHRARTEQAEHEIEQLRHLYRLRHSVNR